LEPAISAPESNNYFIERPALFPMMLTAFSVKVMLHEIGIFSGISLADLMAVIDSIRSIMVSMISETVSKYFRWISLKILIPFSDKLGESGEVDIPMDKRVVPIETSYKAPVSLATKVVPVFLSIFYFSFLPFLFFFTIKIILKWFDPNSRFSLIKKSFCIYKIMIII